ncbi:MAG: hypothetical protein ABI461_22665, partial [Polyangiaceae bacterium]
VLDFPAPDPSPRTNAYDIFIEPGVDGGAHTTASWRDPGSAFDRASAFTLLDAKLTGAQRAYAIARGIFRAIAYRVAPATDDVTAESETTALADLVVPNGAERDASFEARPDRAVCDGFPEAPALALPFARGASFFYSWLDDTYANSPGGFTRALWALTPTKTLAGATHWTSDPDTFDVLRMTFKVQNATISYADLMLDFAVARAFDPVANARRDWDIDWPKQARRLAPALPIAPTGSSYLLIRKAGAPAGSRLRIEATWEEHAAFQWLAIKLDAHGSQLGRVPIPAQDKGVSAQITLDNLDDTSAILLVVSNAGDDAVPFDPDMKAWEPHGYLVTVAAQ